MQGEQVLERPIISEKATRQGERFNQFAFAVALAANKYEIRAAVQAAYNVKVVAVRTLRVAGKLKRRGTSVGKRPNWKKAVVTLAKGETIDFYAVE